MNKYLTDAERIKAQQELQSLAFDLKELGRRMDEVSEVIAKPILAEGVVVPDTPVITPAPGSGLIIPPAIVSGYSVTAPGQLSEVAYAGIGKGLIWDNWWGEQHLNYNNLYNDLALGQRLVPAPNGSDRVGAWGTLANPGRVIELSQWIRFGEAFEFVLGGKVGFGIGGGDTPTGGDPAGKGCTARLMWRPEGRFGIYEYSASQTALHKYGRDTHVPDFLIPRGQWFKCIMRVGLNTSPNKSDGWCTIEVEGHNGVGRRDNIQWMSAADVHALTRSIYSCFYGGGDPEWAPEKTNYISYGPVEYKKVA